MLCLNCTELYNSWSCPWCELRREELLERLQPEEGVATIAEVAGWAAQGTEERPGARWRIV